MKNFELLNNHAILSNIPLIFESRELSSKLQAKIMLMRVSYEKYVTAFDEKIKEALEKMKPEGFNDLAREVEKMRSIEAKIDASESELAEAKKIRDEKLAEYEPKEKDVIEKFNELRKQELENESDIKVKKFTEDEYAEIISIVKSEGDEYPYKVNGQTIKVPRLQFLGMIAANLVE